VVENLPSNHEALSSNPILQKETGGEGGEGRRKRRRKKERERGRGKGRKNLTVTQAVGHLLCNHEVLSSNPSTIKKKKEWRRLRKRDYGGNVTNVQYKSDQNCHYESPLHIINIS
jgi:hypothetical protein